ncbi:MAG: hypothetical protein ACRDT6_27485 [Micromonosporaceae bacterium]
MTKVLTVEFEALYQVKKLVEQCAATAASLKDHAEDLALPQAAFTTVDNSKEIHGAWKTVCEDRKKEAAALQSELEAVASVLKSVAELYGWTDGEMAAVVARAEKLR